MSSERASVTRHVSEDGDEPLLSGIQDRKRRQGLTKGNRRRGRYQDMYVASGHLVLPFSRVYAHLLARK